MGGAFPFTAKAECEVLRVKICFRLARRSGRVNARAAVAEINRTWYRGDSDFGSLSKRSFWLPINISDFDEVKGLKALNKSLAGRICTARTWWPQTSEKDFRTRMFLQIYTVLHGLQLVPHLWQALGHFSNHYIVEPRGWI